MRSAALDEVGDIGAPPGTRLWSTALKRSMRAAINDERSSAKHLHRLMTMFSEHRGYCVLDDPSGEPFPSFEAFCQSPPPWGLGYELDAINGIINERKSAEMRARNPKDVAVKGSVGRGRNRCSDTTPIGDDRGADYLTARIARDHPAILQDMQSGKYKSVRQAALAAGIVRPRASVYVDDPDAVAAFLAKHFEPADIQNIANLAISLKEGSR